MELDAELEKQAQTLKHHRSEAEHYDDLCRRSVADGKKRREELTHECLKLQTHLKTQQDTVTRLENELLQAESDFTTEQRQLNTQITTVQVSRFSCNPRWPLTWKTWKSQGI